MKKSWAFAGVFHNGFYTATYTKEQVKSDLDHFEKGIRLGFKPPSNYKKALKLIDEILK